MVVKIKQTTDVTLLEDMKAYTEGYNKLVADEGRRIFEGIKPPLLDELRFYPDKPPNSTYERTNTLKEGWFAEFQSGQNGFNANIGNDTDYTQWVVGSLAQDRDAAARFQQEFHANNGWPLATDTVGFWLDAYVEDLDAWHQEELSQFGGINQKRRAYTRIRRRRNAA